MNANLLTIPYPSDLLLSLKVTPKQFESDSRLLLAVKLYELGRITTGLAAQLAGVDRATFIFELGKLGLSPSGVEADELEMDVANA